MHPQANSSDPIPFNQLGAKPFERLCRHLLREQPGVKSARLFGHNQQGQNGIDVLIELEGKDECWAAQCKAYASYSKGDLVKAIDEFRKYLKYWKKRKLSRFIVFVGCGIVDRFVQDGLKLIETEFAQHDIKVEVWDSDEIARRLKPFPFIVKKAFRSHTETWLESICDLKEPIVSVEETKRSEDLKQLQSVVDELGGLRNAELDSVRELSRTGSWLEAEQKLKAMERAETWPFLPGKLRARALRMHAGLVLNRREDVKEARSLLNKADSLDGVDPSRFHNALLALHEKGAKEALDILDDAYTIDEWHLRAILFVNARRFDDALELLTSGDFEENAETFRIRAIANLHLRRPAAARTEIDSALSHSPSWFTILEAAAKIYYHSSISTGSPDWGIWDSPAPARWEFVKSDPESVKHLEKAEQLFSQLRSVSSIDQSTLISLECWILACLANCRDDAKQEEANSLAQKIVRDTPLTFPAIVWSLERGYEIPVADIRSRLEEFVESSPALENLHTLLVLLIRTGEFSDAATLLDRYHQIYEDTDNHDAWSFHRIQIAYVNEEEEIIQKLTADGKNPSLIAIRTEGAKEGWNDARLSALTKAYEDTQSAEALYNACEAHHLAGRPDFVVKHAVTLLKKLPSESALALSINAAYSSGAVAECISLSDDFHQLFHKGVIPEEVRRLRAWCFTSLGKHSDAARELRMLNSPHLNDFDKISLFEAEYQSGDMKRTLQIAQDLIENKHTPPELLLHIIDRTRADDPSLAQRAFERIEKSGITDPTLAARAYFESFHLGLEHKAKSFLRTAAAEMGKPGSALVPFSVEEFLKHSEESHRAREERLDLYRRGEIPTHLLESAGDDNLSNLVALLPDGVKESKSRLSSSWSLRIRHGSIRKSRIRTRVPPGGIFLDPTSLLILQQLKLLSKLTEVIPAVRVSASTNAWIQKQVHDLSGHQLSQKTSKQVVLDLFDQSSFEEFALSGRPTDDHDLEGSMGSDWCELLETALKMEGYLVDFVPVTENKLDGKPVELASEISDKVIGALQLCVSAREAGFISLEKYHACLDLLNKGSESLPEPVTLEESSVLVLERGQAEYLASIGILKELGISCRLLILSEEIERIRSELRFQKKRDGLISQLKELRDYLKIKIDSSEFLEETSEDTAQFDQDGKSEADPLMRCVRDTLNPGRPVDVWTCVDDRRFSVQPRIGKSRVVGTFDIIDFLFRNEKLTVREMYELRRQMRLRNFRLIQADPAEIVTLLGDCFNREPSGKESVELADLRKYYAGVFLNGDDLQRPHGNFQKARVLTELRVLLQTGAAAAEALFTIWSNDKDSEALRRIKSDWILDSLWFDASGSNQILSEFEVSSDLEALASQHLFFLALKYTHEKDESTTPYLRWLFSRLTSRPSRWIPILSEAKKFLVSSIHNLDGDENIELKRYTAFKMHEKIEEALPPELKPFFAITDEDKEFLGEAQFLLVGIGPFQFDASELWSAARSALNGNPAQVQPIKAPEGCETLELAIDEEIIVQPALRFDSESEEKGFTWEQPLLALLSNSASDVPGADEDLRKSLDMNCKQGMKELSRMRSIENLSERIYRYSEIETKSIPRQLRSITEKLKNEGELDLTVARPRDLDTLLRHVRILPGNNPETILQSLKEGAKTLIREEGFLEAFKRHSSLPYFLSPPFFREFKKLPIEELDRFRTYAEECDTVPLTALHASTILLVGSKEDKEKGIALICRLLEKERVPLFRYFKRILEWSFSCLLNDHVGEVNFFDHMIAAWVHSGRVHQTIGSPTAYEEIGDFFASNRNSIAGLTFLPEFSRFYHPINPTMFLTPGLVLGAVSRGIKAADLTDAEKQKLGSSLHPLCFPYKNLPDQPDVSLSQLSGQVRHSDRSLQDCFELKILEELPGLENLSKASSSSIEVLIDQVLGALEEDPKNVELWLTLAGMLGINCPNETHGRRLRELIEKLSFSDLDATPEMFTKLGMFIFNLARFPSFREAESTWSSLASDFGERLLAPSFAADPKDVAQACFFAACSVPMGAVDSASDANRAVADIVRSMVAASGACPRELRQMVSNLANMIPGRDNAPLWRLLLELREH